MTNSKTLPIFPISPAFISKLPKTGDQPKYNYDDLNNNGVFDYDIIEGFMAITSRADLVKHSTAFFEFIPKEFDIDQNSNDYEILNNLDDDIQKILDNRKIGRPNVRKHLKHRPSCEFFRTKCKEDCYHINARVGFFSKKGLKQGEIKRQLEIELKDYNDKNNSDIEIVTYSDREYLRYTCPHSGFIEFVFPIFHEKRIVGGLMLGQYIPNHLTKEESYDKYVNHLKKRKKKLGVKELENLKSKILKQFDVVTKGRQKLKNQLGISSHEELFNKAIEKIFQHIDNFEDRFNKRVNLHRQRFIINNFNKIKKEFHEKNKLIDKKLINKGDQSVIDHLSKNIEDTLKKVIRSFYNDGGFFRVFGVREFTKSNQLNLLAATDRDNVPNIDDYWYDLTQVPNDIRESKEQITNKDREEINNGLKIKEKVYSEINDDDILRYFPTLASNITFVIWRKYKRKAFFKKTEDEHRRIFIDAIVDLYVYFTATYAYLWGSINEKNLEHSMRIAGHEANQIIPVIKNSIMRNIDRFDRLQLNIQNRTLYKKTQDVYNNLELLKFTMSRPTFIFKSGDIKKKDTDVHEILFKLRNVYNVNMYHKKIALNIKRSDVQHIEILAEPLLFEHMINNLVDNAIKYSFRGTSIQVTTKVEKIHILLHIISFGAKIEDSKRIYEIYERERLDFDGLGIGLYLSKNIAEAHAGMLNHSSVMISN
jgi:signal transduction histidine kinase